MQRWTCIGNLGADPDLRFTTSGRPVCTISVASTRKWWDKQTNEQKSDTHWQRCVIWGDSAERAAKILAKGKQVYIEGRLQTDSWEDKEGVKRYTTDVVVQAWRVLGPAPKGDGRPHPAEGGPAGRPDGWNDDYIPSDPGDDDIPF